MTTDHEHSLLAPDATVLEAMRLLEKNPLHFVMVVDRNRFLLGTITDGDIRRGLLRGMTTGAPVTEVMNPKPIVLTQPYARDMAVALMRRHAIRQIPIVDGQRRVIGAELVESLVEETEQAKMAVIMAGGQGKRLRPLTDVCPKPLLSVGGKPVVEIVIEGLVAAGFRQVTLCVHYLADMIMNTLGDGSRWGIEIHYVPEDQHLGTAGGLALLDPAPTAPFLVINADVVTRCDFRHLLEFHAVTGSLATMCVRQYELEVPYGVIHADEHGLASIEEKPMQKFLVNAGIYVLDPKVLSEIPKGKAYDMTTLFAKLIQQQQPTRVFLLYEYWADIGHHRDLYQANRDFPSMCDD